MKKITLIVLILFGIGLSTPISASDNPTPKAPAPGCPGNIVNGTPCPLKVCLNYTDCFGVPKVACATLAPGGVIAYSALSGGCCSSVTSVFCQLLGPPAPVSPVVPVGSTAPYMTGAAPPCNLMIIDFMNSLPDCVIHP